MDRFQEYDAYYAARAERYADNPNYKHSFKAEQDLLNGYRNAGSLEEFKSVAPALADACAVARMRDLEEMDLAYFHSVGESVRALAPQRILEKVQAGISSQDLASVAVEEGNRNSIEISMDESVREFNDWGQLENIEVYSKAKVPDAYKQTMQDGVEDSKRILRESVKDLEEQNQPWQAGWKMTPDLILEERHRRFLPFDDREVRSRLQEYKTIVNR